MLYFEVILKNGPKEIYF